MKETRMMCVELSYEMCTDCSIIIMHYKCMDNSYRTKLRTTVPMTVSHRKPKTRLFQSTVNREYFDVKIFLDSMACAKIKRTKYMRNINDNVAQGRLSENYLTQKIIA